MKEMAIGFVIGGVIASSLKSSLNTTTKSLAQIGNEVKKLNKQKIDIKRFRELQKNTQGNRKEFVKLGRSLKASGVDLKNFSKYTVKLNKQLLQLKKNSVIKGRIEIEKQSLFSQKDSLFATLGLAAAVGGVINLRSEVMQAQGELKSLKIGDVGIEKITAQAKKFSNEFAGTTTPQFIKAAYDIKSGISSLGDEAVGKFTRLAAITAGATKSSTEQMTSFFATGYGIYNKQFAEFGARTIKGWDKLSQEEKDIKFGESFSAGIGTAVQMFKTDGTKMQNAMETLGAAATTSNVPLSEQIAILGQMQKTFASGSEAATAYKGFLSGAVKAQEELGLEFLDSNNQLKSAPLILEELRTKYGDTLDDMEKQELKKAFGTEEGLKFITAYYGEVDELKTNINSMASSMKDGTKTVDDMMKATQSGKGFTLFAQQMGNLGATVGKIFYPALSLATTVLGVLVVGLDSLITEFPIVFNAIGFVVGGFITYIAISKTAMIVSTAYKISMLALRGSFLANVGVVKALRISLNRLTIQKIGTTLKTKALIVSTWALGAAQTAAGMAGKVFATGMMIAGKAMNFLKMNVRLLIGATGIGLLLVAAGLIYEYWSPIKEFFSDLWDGIMQKAMPFFNWISDKISIVGETISSFASFFGFGDDEEDTTKKSKVGGTLKKATASMVVGSQLATAQPNLSYAQMPDIQPKTQTQQITQHVKVVINNPADTVEVEKAIRNAMANGGADRSLSDEDI